MVSGKRNSPMISITYFQITLTKEISFSYINKVYLRIVLFQFTDESSLCKYVESNFESCDYLAFMLTQKDYWFLQVYRYDRTSRRF